MKNIVIFGAPGSGIVSDARYAVGYNDVCYKLTVKIQVRPASAGI